MGFRSNAQRAKSTPGAHAPGAAGAGWAELFTGEYAFYTGFLVLGVVLYSIQTLVIVTIMPTVVEDIGGAAYYVWASMLYLVGTILGAASVGPAWAALGSRRVFALAGSIFALGTLGCALAPDMLTLVITRALQGFGGGLITGGLMSLVSALFPPGQRTRILAIYQGAWTLCSLLGPFFGGAFAEIGWWRGSFWSFVPVVIGFCAMAWWKLPQSPSAGGAGAARLPVMRLGVLALGVIGVAQAGQLASQTARAAALALAIVLIGTAFRMDRRAVHRLFPSRPLSVTRPVGLGYWILIIVGAVQSAVTIFLPLALQIVHEVTPLLVGVSNLLVSSAWTIATFMVSGWSGARERFALRSGPVLMLAGVAMMLGGGSVAGLLAACFVFGFGIGIHNVHLNARLMEAAVKGEEALTASSMSMIRPLGMAVGTAAAGMVANTGRPGTADRQGGGEQRSRCGAAVLDRAAVVCVPLYRAPVTANPVLVFHFLAMAAASRPAMRPNTAPDIRPLPPG